MDNKPSETFYAFLKRINKFKWDNPIGDLAKDVSNDQWFPRGRRKFEHYERHILHTLGTENRGAMDALEEAYQLYMSGKHDPKKMQDDWQNVIDDMNKEIEKDMLKKTYNRISYDVLEESIPVWNPIDDANARMFAMSLFNDIKLLKQVLEEEFGPEKTNDLLEKMELKKPWSPIHLRR